MVLGFLEDKCWIHKCKDKIAYLIIQFFVPGRRSARKKFELKFLSISKIWLCFLLLYLLIGISIVHRCTSAAMDLTKKPCSKNPFRRKSPLTYKLRQRKSPSKEKPFRRKTLLWRKSPSLKVLFFLIDYEWRMTKIFWNGFWPTLFCKIWRCMKNRRTLRLCCCYI